jgi:hypothetical protein
LYENILSWDLLKKWLGLQTTLSRKMRPNVLALYFSLGFETLSTETLLTKINVFLHLQSKN